MCLGNVVNCMVFVWSEWAICNLMLYIFHAVVFYTIGLFPAAAQSLVIELLHVSTACCIHHCRLLIKRYNLCKVLACSTVFLQLSLSCATFFQLHTFVLLISSKMSSSQRVLGLPIDLLDMGFHLLIFWTLLSLAMRSTWPNRFNLCFLINPIYFVLLIYHWFLDYFWSHSSHHLIL